MRIELSNDLKIKIATILMVLMFFSLWEVGAWLTFVWMLLGLFFPVALFFKPDKWLWSFCVVILLAHALYLPFGLSDIPIRYVCGCPSGPDWEYVARNSITLILCIPALVLLLPAGKPLFQSAKVFKYYSVLIFLIMMTILLVIMPILVLISGSNYSRRAPYTYEQDEIQEAVSQYQQSHSGALPIIQGANVSINESSYSVIDLCQLFYIPNQPEWKHLIPYGVYSTPGPGNDNCDGPDACCGCCVTSHYIWAVDVNGSVLSTCVNTDSNGGGCANVSQDGYQGVWP